MKKGFLFCVLICSAFLLQAQTELASMFSDHMVLQRNAEVAIWGKDKPHTKISIEATWGEKDIVYSDAEGRWKTDLKTHKAGGPYQIDIKGSEQKQISDILLGEVWLCSGQSNMEMPLKGFLKGQGVSGSNQEILNSTNSQLRFFTVERNISSKPQEACNGKWELSNRETSAEFSAVAYFYGKILQAQLKVPIGVICSSWGGTPAEAWTPKNVISEDFKEFNSVLKDESAYYQKTPTVLFNGMINPLIPFTMKGVIWYQGEANRKNAEQYSRLFPAMIKSWRDRWNLGDFPFYFVQISSFEWGGEPWVELRESQLKTMLSVPNTGMAVTLDIGDKFCIHPPKKKEVGERLAYWALAKTYGFKGIQYSGPVYKSMEIKESKAYLSFDYAPYGVCSMENKLENFEIAGADQVFYPAEAEIKKGQLIVWNKDVKEPTIVRYGWTSYLNGCLFNTAGLPASSFRTDHL
ncbi:sialate O-acetylesterase [Ancylomarina sp. 16SWW S1-10-2]|uniref:sialate O-acetylesterase n=1 Tax=Ancylomarina sp. 16SWW S1-10-2 TaxID=2499681 RepID=UPI0012AE7FF1|nr:sialate O-acetylesterase [Ancylomarina sp. 16SWW S1-10-2]MRT91970.1 sialate O-acetylesterase [Ancylomarina sp. 16SWW S1-10-2]